MLQVKVFNIRYKKRESVITVSGFGNIKQDKIGIKIDSLNSWLYHDNTDKSKLDATVINSDNAMKEFIFDIDDCYDYDDLLSPKVDDLIKDEIYKRTMLKAEAYSIKVLG